MRRFLVKYWTNVPVEKEIVCDLFKVDDELIYFIGTEQDENKGGILIPKQPKAILVIQVNNLASIEEI